MRDLFLTLMGAALALAAGLLFLESRRKPESPKNAAPPLAEVRWVVSALGLEVDANGKTHHVDLGFQGDGTVLWRVGEEKRSQ